MRGEPDIQSVAALRSSAAEAEGWVGGGGLGGDSTLMPTEFPLSISGRYTIVVHGNYDMKS